MAYDIGVADGNVVVVGVATRDTSYFDSQESACYWLNGELHYLVNQYDVPEGTEGWEWSAARGVTLSLTPSYSGSTWHVSTSGSDSNDGNEASPFATIQHGIDVSSDGDTVMVAAGTYVENINYNGKNIVVGSLYLTTQDTSYISSTIIDGGDLDAVVKITTGEDQTTELVGFTIQNGQSINGGGIEMSGSSASLKNLVIKENQVTMRGGGIECRDGCIADIINCKIINNYSAQEGGGIRLYNATANITNCEIYNNNAPVRAGGIDVNNNSTATINGSIIHSNTSQIGGAIRIYNGSSLTLINSLFYNNSVTESGTALDCRTLSNATIINTNIINNNANANNNCVFADDYSALAIYNSIIRANGTNNILHQNNSTITVGYSNIEGGYDGEGNIDADPLFVDVTNGDYHLSNYSSAIGAGLDTTIVDTIDIEGNPRPNPSDSNPDMGAYENALGAPVEHIVITNDSLVVLEDSSSTMDLLDNDLILNITSFTLAIVDSADNGTIALVGDTALTYTPDANFFGYDTVSYRVFSSEAADSGLVLITVTAVNDAPVIVTAISDMTVDEDSDSVMLADLDVIFNDVDSDLTFNYTNDNTGLLTVNVDGDNAVTLTFTPDSSGIANLTFIADDGEYTVTDSVVVTVNPVNDAPGIVLPDTFEFSEDDLLTVYFTPYFNDIDSDTSLVLTATGNVYINVAIDTFLVTFTADTNWNGFEDIVFTIDDQNLRFTDSDTVRVSVLAVNDAPVITALDSVTITEDSFAEVSLLATDMDGDSLTFVSTSTDTSVITIVSNDTLTLTPAVNWNGTADITVFVSDGFLSDTTSFVLTVTPVNDAPGITLPDTTINEGGVIEIILLADDIDGDELTYSSSSDTNAVIINVNEDTLLVSLIENWNGSSVITVVVTDENATSDTAEFILTVNPVNDSPEEFSVIYPTVSDTFSTHADNDSLIQFIWGKSNDVDSEVNYTLTIELEFFGNVYTDFYDDISDTTISISSNSLDPLLNVTAQDEAVFTFYVQASDEEYTVSDTGEFILSREALGIDDEVGIPDVFALHQNYPNPFNPITTLRYDLPEQATVNIIIYDMLGREIKTLVNTTQNAGFKSVIWNATNDYGKPVSAGVYLYKIQAGEFVQTKKMVLLK